MSKKPPRVPPTTSARPPDAVFVWPCGCVTQGSRNGPLERDCGDPSCYRRRAPRVRRL